MKKLYILLFTFLITAYSFGQEMLTNGNLESWDDSTTPTGWSKSESATQEATTVHGGSNSAKVVATGTRDLTQSVSVDPGESYTITVWYYVESGDSKDARIWCYWLNGTSTVTDAATNDALRGPAGSYLTSDTSWQQYTTTVTAPSSGVDGFRFEVRTYNGSTVYWDDLSFVDNNTLSVENNQIEGFSMYPNPTSLGYVNIRSKSNSKLTVDIFDVLGKQVINETVSNKELNVSNLNTGIYIMKVSQENATITKKLVIQ